MTDHIEFGDDEFSFHLNGVSFHVRTEVGNGPARVIVEELAQQEVDMEGEEA